MGIHHKARSASESEINGIHETSSQFFSELVFRLPCSSSRVLKGNTAGGFHCPDDHREENTLKHRGPEADGLLTSTTQVPTAIQLLELWRRIINA